MNTVCVNKAVRSRIPHIILLYINDISASYSLLHRELFADDTNLFYHNKSIQLLEQTVNTELDSLSDWFTANKLSLNIDKTNFILFKSVNKIYHQISIFLDGRTVKRVPHVKFLEGYLDKKLHWTSHITNISNKISKKYWIIRLKYKLTPPYSSCYTILLFCFILSIAILFGV